MLLQQHQQHQGNANSNNTSTYVQFAALSGLLIWRPLPRVPGTSPMPQPHPHPTYIHIQGGWRTCGKLLCNYEIFCASSALLRCQRPEVMLNKPGADFREIKQRIIERPSEKIGL